MRALKKIRKFIAALLICAVLLTSSFSHEAHAEVMTGVAISSILNMLQNIFYTVSIGRAGLRSNSSTDDLIDVIHDAEDAVFSLGSSLVCLDPNVIVWNLSNAAYNRVSYALSNEAFGDYLADQNKIAAEATDEDLDDYLNITGLGDINSQGVASLSSTKINEFAEWIYNNKDNISSVVRDPLAEYPSYPDVYFDIVDTTYATSISRILADLNVQKGNSISQSFSYNQFVIPDVLRNGLNNFNYFDLSNEPFIISINGDKCILFKVPQNSIIIRNSDGLIVNIIDTDSFLFRYCHNIYGANLIYNMALNFSMSSVNYSNDSWGQNSSTWNYFSFLDNSCYQLYTINFGSDHYIHEYTNYNGLTSLNPLNIMGNNYWVFPLWWNIPYGYYSFQTNYYINFDNVQSSFVLNIDNSITSYEKFPTYGVRYSFLDSLINNVNSILSYSLILNSPTTTAVSQGVVSSDTEEGEGIQVPTVIFNNTADVPVDITQYSQVNDVFENTSSTDALAEIYNTNFASLTEGLEDLLYRTSTIYKLLQSLGGSITAIPTLLTSIFSAVGGLASSIGDEIGNYVIDAESGDNLLEHLIPIDNIAAGMAAVPDYFIDADSGDNWLENTAVGVDAVVDALGVESGAASISDLLSGVREDIADLTDALTGEDEVAGAVPIATTVSGAITVDENGNPRTTNNINSLLLLPLVFIFILLMVLFLLLKALAFAAMIFRTPASTAFINSNMVSGLNWLKTTYITNGGGSLDLENGSGLSASGLFSNISIWALLIFCVDLVALFAIVKVVKRWADRQHGD